MKSIVLLPGGPSRAGVLNFSIPGGSENDMPAIAQWFAENPPQDARP